MLPTQEEEQEPEDDDRAAHQERQEQYLESSGPFILSIGYRDDEPGYEVKLNTVDLGRIEGLDPAGLSKVEQAMASASSKLKNVICHELYVTEKKELLMVFMTHLAG